MPEAYRKYGDGVTSLEEVIGRISPIRLWKETRKWRQDILVRGKFIASKVDRRHSCSDYERNHHCVRRLQ